MLNHFCCGRFWTAAPEKNEQSMKWMYNNSDKISIHCINSLNFYLDNSINDKNIYRKALSHWNSISLFPWIFWFIHVFRTANNVLKCWTMYVLAVGNFALYNLEWECAAQIITTKMFCFSFVHTYSLRSNQNWHWFCVNTWTWMFSEREYEWQIKHVNVNITRFC